MAGNFQLSRLRAVILCGCMGLVGFLPTSVRAGGGLAAIDAFHVGRYHLANGDRTKALDAFNDSLRMNPQFVQAYVARGKLLAELGQLDSALADLNFALRLQPTHAEGFAYRGFVLLSQGKPQESLPEFDMALRLDPSYARVMYLRGQALKAVGNEADGATSIAAALQLDPSIEVLQVVTTGAELNVPGNVQINTPGALERTSSIANSDPPVGPQLTLREQGRVIRPDRHPVLANLQRPFPVLPTNADAMGNGSSLPRTINDSSGTQIVRRPGPNKVSSSPTKPAQPSKVPTPSTEELKPSSAVDAPTLTALPTVEPIVADVVKNAPGVIVSKIEIDAAELPLPAAAILSGAVPGDAVPAKPAEEASLQRIADAVAAARQAVPAVAPSAVSDNPKVADSNTPAVEVTAEVLPPFAAVNVADMPGVAMIGDASDATSKIIPTTTVGDLAASKNVTSEEDLQAAELCRLRGIEQEEKDDPAAALAEYDNAVRLDPNNPQNYCLRGRLFLQGEFAKEAIADFDRAIELAPGLTIGYFGRAHARYIQHNFADAVDDYSVVLRLDDQHARALIERGHCLAQLGEAEAAETDRLAALALDPSLAKSGPKYGNAIPKAPAPADMNMPEEPAVAYVDDSPAKPAAPIASESGAPSAFGALFAGDHPTPTTPNVAAPTTVTAEPLPVANEPAAVALGATTTVSDAVPAPIVEPSAPLADDLQQLTDELAHTPGDARLYFRRAELHLQANRAEDAIDDLNAALRIEPTFAPALAKRAEAHVAVQRLPAAEADLSELLRLQPQDGTVYAERGSVKLALGFAAEAVADLTQALTLEQGNAEAYCRRGLAYAVLGDAEKSMADFTAALERNPNDAEAYLSRGRAYAEFEYPAEALADFNRCLELDPKCADAYFERSRLYAVRGAYEKSQSDRRKALELDPTLR